MPILKKSLYTEPWSRFQRAYLLKHLVAKHIAGILDAVGLGNLLRDLEQGLTITQLVSSHYQLWCTGVTHHSHLTEQNSELTHGGPNKTDHIWQMTIKSCRAEFFFGKHLSFVEKMRLRR